MFSDVVQAIQGKLISAVLRVTSVTCHLH